MLQAKVDADDGKGGEDDSLQDGRQGELSTLAVIVPSQNIMRMLGTWRKFHDVPHKRIIENGCGFCV